MVFTDCFPFSRSQGDEPSNWFQSLLHDKEDLDQLAFMSIVFWSIWSHRNMALYDNIHQSTAMLWTGGLTFFKEFKEVKADFEGKLHQASFSWCPPTISFTKINIDAFFTEVGSPAGGGWICRDQCGCLLLADSVGGLLDSYGRGHSFEDCARPCAYFGLD